MPDPLPDPTEPVEVESEPITVSDLARATAGTLLRLSGVGQAGLVILGGLLGLTATPEALAPGASAIVVVNLLARVGLAVVIGLVVGHLLRGFGVLLFTLAEQAEATARLEKRTAEALAQPGIAGAVPLGTNLKAADLAEIRQAIRAGRWLDAHDLVRTFAETHPEDPDSARIAEEFSAARQAESEVLKARIAAAREVNDPDRVIALRDALKPLLDPEPLKALDRDLARWFMTVIQKRLRAGTVRHDVAALAGRIAASLDDTPEGASLRASLPTLRRAAGLCPRCAEPYAGTASACPACLAAVRLATPPSAPNPPDSPSRENSP